MKKICWVVCIVALLIPAKAFAVSLAMTPTFSNLSIQPNKKARDAIEITNTGYTTIKLMAYASGLLINQDGSLSYTSGPFTAEKWITITPKEFSVKPSDFGVVRFEVNVQGDPAPTPGTYMAAILIEEAPNVPMDQEKKKEVEGASAGLTIGGRFAYPVYIDVGEQIYDAKIESFEVKRENDKSKFAFRIRNLGSFNYPAKGVIKIESGGKKAQEINTALALVLRNAVKTVTVDVPGKLAPGSYEAFLSLDLNKGQKLEARTSFTITQQ
jgi:hypothetical protein